MSTQTPSGTPTRQADPPAVRQEFLRVEIARSTWKGADADAPNPEAVIYADERDHLHAMLTCGHYSPPIFDRSSTWDFTHEEQNCPHGCAPVFFIQEVQDRANAPEPPPVHPLATAYHAIFDVKDAADPGSPVFQQAFYAARHVADLMNALGMEAPRRFDAPR